MSCWLQQQFSMSAHGNSNIPMPHWMLFNLSTLDATAIVHLPCPFYFWLRPTLGQDWYWFQYNIAYPISSHAYTCSSSYKYII